MKEDEDKYVGIWLRVSTEDQAQGESPEHHERRARAYADAKGWQVKEVYDLSGVSGKSVMAHPKTRRMLADVRSGAISGLIFSKLARLARNTKELLEFSDIFREHDAGLISLGEAIDTTTPAGRLFYTMIAAMAQWEREEISSRVAASVPIRAKLGKSLGGKATFGYQWQENQLVPHPDEAPVRRLIYELFREHKRKKTVATILNERGYRTRNDALFSRRTVERLLRDPTAKGLRRANTRRVIDERGRSELKAQSEWVYTEVEPIVSAELWDEVNAILDEQKRNQKPRSRRTVHLFAGVVVCHCGTKMYVPSNTPKYVCQKCRNKIPIVDLENIFQTQLKHFFFSPEEMSEYLQEGNRTIQEKEQLLDVLAGERKKLRSEMDKLYELYIAGEIPKSGFGEKYNPLHERVEQIDDELPALQAECDVLKINQASSDVIIQEARDLYSRWGMLSVEEKRAIVEAITESIVVGDEDIEINLCYLPRTTEGPHSPDGPEDDGSGGSGGGGNRGSGSKVCPIQENDDNKCLHPVACAQDNGSSSCPIACAAAMNPATGRFIPGNVSKNAAPRVRPGQPPARSKSSKVAFEGEKVLVSC